MRREKRPWNLYEIASPHRRFREPGGDAISNKFHGRFSRRIRSEEHTSELQSRLHLVCRLLLEKKKGRARAAAESPRACTPTPRGPSRRWQRPYPSLRAFGSACLPQPYPSLACFVIRTLLVSVS